MNFLRSLRSALLATAAGLVPTVWGQAPDAGTVSQYPECDCPPGFEAILAAWDFENLPNGPDVPSVDASYVSPLVNVTEMTGPGSVTGVIPGSPSGQWACFTGFPTDGGEASVGFKLEYTSSEIAQFCGLCFDAYSEADELGTIHGPTELYLNIYVNGSQVWQSETVNVGTGIANAFSFDINNPDGNDLNGDGLSFTGGDFSWMELNQGDILAFEIVGSGANDSQMGLHLDNVEVHACTVPEPSAALMLLVAGFFYMGRSRRFYR
ncbi:MAG: hypothetical protein KDK99_16290 [Verrucomicrobiales bacterium]|nr:hypothetical protein [Verrucomicrobiales bacterium]